MDYVALLVGLVLGAVIAYFVIRLAVNHGMRDAQKPKWERPAESLPPPAATWFNKDPN